MYDTPRVFGYGVLYFKETNQLVCFILKSDFYFFVNHLFWNNQGCFLNKTLFVFQVKAKRSMPLRGEK